MPCKSQMAPIPIKAARCSSLRADINVSTTTIRMKLAPQAQATAFLTAASLAANLGAGISPLIGGAFVDFFSVRHLEVAIEWVDPTRSIGFPAIFLTGYVFLFATAFVLGLFTFGILGKVREEGEVQSEVVMDRLMNETRENLHALNIVPGLGSAAHAIQAAVEATENVSDESRAEIKDAVLQELSKET